MTLDEVRLVLMTAAWSDEKTPLVTLFDELVDHHNEPRVQVKRYEATEGLPGRVTAAFGSLTQPSTSSGQIVALVLSLRQECKLPLYEVSDERDDVDA